MTRSHFGDLQFLHSMANEEGIPAGITRSKVLDWMEFTWKVFDGAFGPDTLLRSIDIPTIKEHFGCSDWTVSDIYILGRKDTLIRRLPDIAFGSILHTVQDSFAAGHVSREPAELGASCSSGIARPGRIVEFHAYGQQDGHKHDAEDSREAMAATADDTTNAISISRELLGLWDANANWANARPLMECIFELSPSHRPSSPGAAFRRGQYQPTAP